MDISETLAPNSDQLDAIDLSSSGPRVFTITEVSKGKEDQPVNIHLAEFPRVWRPGKSMRRVLAACWGTDTSVWVGRRVKLYCDDKVRFGPDVVGGTRISHLSDIAKTRTVPLLVSRGKSAQYKVEPLTDSLASPEQTKPTAADVAATTDKDVLKAMWQASGADMRAIIEARVSELDNPPTPDPADELPIAGEGA